MTAATITALYPFEDVIDGYFPLQASLDQMMDRLGVSQAVVEIRFAPIMDIPNLAPTDPVPLNIRAGRAGIIDQLCLSIQNTDGEISVTGTGDWRWLDGEHCTGPFDPMTRLAEPAFLLGWSLSAISHTGRRTLKLGSNTTIDALPTRLRDLAAGLVS
jgi:hypothetical protein